MCVERILAKTWIRYVDKVKNYSEISPPVHWSLRWILVLGVPLLALAFGIGFFFEGYRETAQVVLPAVVQPVPIPVDYKKLIAEKLTEASRQDDLAVTRFNEGLTRSLVSYTARSESAALQTAEKLSSAEDLAYILFYLAKDQTNSGHQTDDYLHSETQPILNTLLGDFGRDTNDLIRMLDNDLRRISTQLAVDLASIGPGKSEVPGHIVLTPDIKREFDVIVKQLGINVTVLSAIAIFSKQVEAAISKMIPKRVVAIAAKMFTRQVAKISASAAIGSIPSPIPLPQLILLGGLAWTAYDIWTIRSDFREDIYKSTKTELEGAGETTRTDAQNFAITKANAFRSVQTAMGSESMKTILGNEERR